MSFPRQCFFIFCVVLYVSVNYLGNKAIERFRERNWSYAVLRTVLLLLSETETASNFENVTTAAFLLVSITEPRQKESTGQKAVGYA
jgi:hypothetical protein